MTTATTSPTLSAALSYARRGWRVIPIHSITKTGLCTCGVADCPAAGKHPRIAGWIDDATTDAEEIRCWYEQWPSSNVGIAFGAATGLVDIETDPRSGGPANLRRLEKRLGVLPSTLSFVSGGGGTHRLFRYPEGYRIRKATHIGRALLGLDRKAVTGIDVMSDGSQAVAPPSRHKSGNTYEWNEEKAKPAELPEAWRDFLAGGGESPQADSAETFLQHGPSVLSDIDEAKAKEILDHLDPSMDHDQWVVIGQALKVQFGDAGLDLFDSWSSASAEKYPGREQIEYQWSTFGRKTRRGEQVTFRSVLALAREAGWAPPSSPAASASPAEERKRLREEDKKHLNHFASLLEDAADNATLSEVAQSIAAVELFNTTIDELVATYRLAFARINPGKKISKTDAEAILRDESKREERAKEAAEASRFYEGWVYVAEGERGAFHHLPTARTVGLRVFDDENAEHLITPVMRAQGSLSPLYLPSDFTIRCGLVEKVAGLRYLPGGEEILEDEGVRYANTYRPPKGEPTPPTLYSAEEKKYISDLDRHLVWMLGEESATIMRQFLGYIVQNPGKRVKWCYLIIGPEGIGKSFLSGVAAAILGKSNVNEVRGSLNHTSFNGWACGAQLNVLEEIAADGANKWEVMDALKAVITNDRIELHRKGKDPTNVDNTASYLAFTNRANAVALKPDARRYYVVSTRFRKKEEYISDLGGARKAEAYFTRLFEGLSVFRDAVAGWALETDLDGFPPFSAPDSTERADMVATSMSDNEVAILSLIDSPHHVTIKPAIINLSDLKEAMSMMEGVSQVTGQGLARTLRDMGYVHAYNGHAVDPYDQGDKAHIYMNRVGAGKILGISPPERLSTRQMRYVLDQYVRTPSRK